MLVINCDNIEWQIAGILYKHFHGGELTDWPKQPLGKVKSFLKSPSVDEQQEFVTLARYIMLTYRELQVLTGADKSDTLAIECLIKKGFLTKDGKITEAGVKALTCTQV